jgi:predicted Zn-dependent peptidase
MKTPVRGIVTLITISLCIAACSLLWSCTKDAEEADKFPRGDAGQPLEVGELTSFRLDNGITVYLHEEHSHPEIAVEAVYRGGVYYEGEGKLQVSRVLPHMLIFSPTANFEADGAVDKMKKLGRVNGEVTGVLTHFDYIVNSVSLDLVLQIESERLTSVKFNEDQLKKYSTKCQEDLDYILNNPRTSMTKYALMAFNQAYNYKKTSIPIYNGVNNLNVSDLERFHRQRFGLEDMVLTVVGDFDSEVVKAQIKERFGSITRDKTTVREVNPVTEDWTAQWDVPSNVMFLVFPGPYKSDKERLVLTMFGVYLNQELQNNQDVYMTAKSTYCSNQVYPVDDIPFFVFVEARPDKNLQDLQATVLYSIGQTVNKVGEGLYGAMRRNMIDFVESSMLKAQLNAANVAHYQFIGQAALNIAMKHYVKEGRTTEEFVEFVNSITYEEAADILRTRMVSENLQTVVITGQ